MDEVASSQSSNAQKDNAQFLHETLQERIAILGPQEQALLLKKLFKDQVIPNSKSYYSQKMALELLPDVQEMIRTGNLAFYSYDESPYKPSSLRVYLYQALAYLADYMDEPDGRYKKFKAEVRLKTIKGKGVLFTYPAKPLKAKMLTPAEVKTMLGYDPASDLDEETENSITKGQEMAADNWKLFLFEYLSSAKKGEPFEMNFNMTEEDKTDLQNTIAETKGFGLVIHKDRPGFKIVKIE